MLTLLATMFGPLWPASAADTAAPKEARRMPRLVSKDVFLPRPGSRPHVTGFVAYVSKSKPVLMHCSGRIDDSDTYDDYAIRTSNDNGRTWSAAEVRWKSSVVPRGRIRYAEPAAFFDPDHEKLVVLIDKALYPKDKVNVDAEYALELNVYDPATGQWAPRRELSFPHERTPAMSFGFPIKTRQGWLLFPGMRQVRDAAGKAVHYKGCWAPVDEMMSVIGQWDAQGGLSWRLGAPRQIAPEESSRGLDENAPIELTDGRIAAVCRGDNSMFPNKAGYKWLTFSRDDGRTWSPPVPLPATGGAPIESGSNGSALFRSALNGRLYWLGNLALHGERAKGNGPRSPLCLVEVQEEPFALKRETIFIVDERSAGDSPQVQFSNFRFYQDRQTGDLVIFLTRYGERSAQQWMLADYYRYRVAMPPVGAAAE
jgi:hypothetical protein